MPDRKLVLCSSYICLYIGLYLFLSAYPEYSFVIDMDTVVMCECIPNPPVSHVRMHFMYRLCFFSNQFVEDVIPAGAMVLPFVIGIPADSQYPAHLTYRIVVMRP